MARVFISPGHSGDEEPGACHHGFRECDIALNISKKLEACLTEAGHIAALYRDGDIVGDSLTQRSEAANIFEADFFISIHCNGFSKPAIRGAEAYYWPTSSEGEAIADEIVDNLCDITGFRNRSARPGRFSVLEAVKCPAVLLEVGFISNFQEAAYMADEAGSTVIAASIASSIDSYFKYREGV